MSSSLVWQIVGHGHAYVKHSNGLKFSCEPGNPTGVYSPKYSGFANAHTVDVSFCKGKSTLNLISTSECGMKREVKPVVIGQCNSKKLQQKVKDALKDHRPDLALPIYRRLAKQLVMYQRYQSSKAKRRCVRNKKLGKKTGKK